MSEERARRIICIKCGYVSKCMTAATMHVMINHVRQDMTILPESISQRCYDCLWQSMVPFKLDGLGRHTAEVEPNSYVLLPY